MQTPRLRRRFTYYGSASVVYRLLTELHTYSSFSGAPQPLSTSQEDTDSEWIGWKMRTVDREVVMRGCAFETFHNCSYLVTSQTGVISSSSESVRKSKLWIMVCPMMRVNISSAASGDAYGRFGYRHRLAVK
jgi:hypothetical protein